jgi:Domain of unknown function (DUF4124)
MNRSSIFLLFQLLVAYAALNAAWAAAPASQSKTYRWVDDQGVVHFGDHIPAEYADTERSVLNSQGIIVARVPGQKSPEEKAEEARAQAKLEEEKRLHEESITRDRVLLSTYLSVEEIEELRDRRLELVDGQMRVTQLYLDNLRKNLLKLERESQRFSPYSKDPNAKPIDEKLARELSDTLDSIALYEQNLEKSATEQAQLTAKFDSDITRFQELKSSN